MLTPFHFIPGTLKDNVDYDNLNPDKKDLVAELVEEFGIRDKCEADVTELSEGEKKKAQAVMTLLKDADLYILDEPLANLDVASKSTVLHRSFERTKGLVVIMHGDEQFRPYFERVIQLQNGGRPQ